MRQAVGGALQRDFDRRFVRIDLASVRDADRYPGEGRTWQTKDVGRQRSRMDDVEPSAPAPAGERPQFARCFDGFEAPHREFGDRFRGVSGTAEPAAFAAKTGDVDGPARSIEPAQQLDHLALGAAGLEAGHHEPNRQHRRP